MENTDIKVFELVDYLPIIKIVSQSDVVLSNEAEDLELQELRKQFTEDMDPEMLKNISEEKMVQLVKRYKSIVNMLKQKHGYKCQICGQSFQMDNEKYYCEAHHLIPISEDGSQSPENVIILCANHHRMFHYAKSKISIQEENGDRIIKINGIKHHLEN